jgi:hypothetical protein
MPSRMIRGGDPRIAGGHRAIGEFWDAIGPSDTDFVSYIINPQFLGNPAWPNTRQAYRVVRPAGTLIIASDGLSDPFVGTDMDTESGFGMEVFIETPDLAGAAFEEISPSWAFRVIENFAMNVADWGGITRQLRGQGVMSVEFPSEDILPPDWLTAQGNAGFLINMPAGKRATSATLPFGEVMIVPLTLIRPNELAYIVEHGGNGRRLLAEKLTEAGHGCTSSLKRASVI